MNPLDEDAMRLSLLPRRTPIQTRVAAARFAIATLATLAGPRLVAQARDSARVSDSAFDAMQGRGTIVMGVDQYTSIHRFDALATGGRIELQRASSADTVGIARVRAHLRDIAHAFASGDFTAPMLVHMKAVPGAATMAAEHDAITYAVHDLPRGGEVVITTASPKALAAIHKFMAFQRSEHHAGGHAM
jgi:hypothetical protein